MFLKYDLYNGRFLSHKKELSADTCYNMDESYKYYAKWEKPDTGYILYDSKT